MKKDSTKQTFNDFDLSDEVLRGLKDIGYETPSPIQARMIPHILDGADVIGQAQTGTGKTAAFALPILSTLNLKQKDPQVLVLAPTRELAIQVAEAFQNYAKYIKGFNVLPVYGGTEYGGQLKQLKSGVHVVVGTPGRVTDHIKRKSLRLDNLKCLVLDEADEMLSMGFIDDIEWILDKTPEGRQIALLSATMPERIKKISNKHLVDPVDIQIKVKQAVVDGIRQRLWMVSGLHKMDALTRILEFEPIDGVIIFGRTKTITETVAEKLRARGYACLALNGDVPQKKRERTVEKLRSGEIDIIIATDVAARGLDVERISHVINYDIPQDTESYIHRIGRTGRAGRKGEAILFVAPRERRLLRAIEAATKQKIQLMDMPSTENINTARIENFKQKITDVLALGELELYSEIIEQYRQEKNIPSIEIAAALAKLAQGKEPLLLKEKEKPERRKSDSRSGRSDSKPKRSKERKKPNEDAFRTEKFRIAVGKEHGVKPADITKTISENIGLERKHIGKIEIEDQFSIINLPVGMPEETFEFMRQLKVSGRRLSIKRVRQGRKKKRNK